MMDMEHVDENTLQLFVLDAEEIRDRRPVIEKHLRECPGCAALVKEMREYYGEVTNLQQEHAVRSREALTLRQMMIQKPLGGDGSLQAVRMTVPARVFAFTARHYVASSISAAAVLTAIFLLFNPLRNAFADRNLSYVRARDEFIVAYNNKGEELWRRHAFQNYDDKYANRIDGTYLTTFSLYGDGHNQVFGIFGEFGTRSPLDNVILCYNDDGGERWRYTYDRSMVFGTENMPDDYLFREIVVGNFGGDGKPLLAAISRHDPRWPSSVLVLDARTGSLAGEFWHSGWIENLVHKDLDGKGVEDILCTGGNNSYSRPAFIILDPRTVTGHGPSTEPFTPQNSPPGTEKFYILLPYSDLMKNATQRYSPKTYLALRGDGSIEVKTEEEYEGERADLLFSFDSTLHCIKVRPTDDFVRLHKRMEAEGRSSERVDDRYLGNLRTAAEYWNGEQFVRGWAINKRYLWSLQDSARN